MKNKLYTLDELKKCLTPIFIEFGLEKAAVFGSYAQKSATPDSDVDLLIATKKVFDLDTYSDFEERLESVLGKNVDIVFFDCINPHMRDQILKEAVSIFDQ